MPPFHLTNGRYQELNVLTNAIRLADQLDKRVVFLVFDLRHPYIETMILKEALETFLIFELDGVHQESIRKVTN